MRTSAYENFRRRVIIYLVIEQMGSRVNQSKIAKYFNVNRSTISRDIKAIKDVKANEEFNKLMDYLIK